MPFKFEKLEIWKLALEYANWIHIATTKFPKEEMFSLSSQFRRAGNSISLNISEGAIGQSNAEQKKFIGYAIRSLSETVNCLYLAERRSYISKEEFNSAYKSAELLFAKMNKFKDQIRD